MKTPPPSVAALFDRARARIPPSTLPLLVMCDPGHPAYVEAYERVLAIGVPALFETVDHDLPRLASFDVTENLLLSHEEAGRSDHHRWFSVLTACIELLGASVYRDVPFSTTLATLLVDTFALEDAAVAGAPIDLLPTVCRAWQELASVPHEATLALVGELLTASLGDAEVDAKCEELVRRHEAAQTWGTPEGEPNPGYAAEPYFVWGAVIRRHELAKWLELTKRHFPSRTPRAAETRERLLRAGEDWLLAPRRRRR